MKKFYSVFPTIFYERNHLLFHCNVHIFYKYVSIHRIFINAKITLLAIDSSLYQGTWVRNILCQLQYRRYYNKRDKTEVERHHRQCCLCESTLCAKYGFYRYPYCHVKIDWNLNLEATLRSMWDHSNELIRPRFCTTPVTHTKKK